MIRSLYFLFLDDFEANANISLAVKSGFTLLMVNLKTFLAISLYLVTCAMQYEQ